MSENLSELNLVFSTPIWTSLVDDYQNINAKMLKYIQSMHEKNPMGTKHSNVIGWHSENFDLEDETVKFFINSTLNRTGTLYGLSNKPLQQFDPGNFGLPQTTVVHSETHTHTLISP